MSNRRVYRNSNLTPLHSAPHAQVEMLHTSWLIGTFATKSVRRILKADLVMGSSCGTVGRNMAESTFRVKIGQNGEFEEGGMKEMKVLNDHSVLVVKNKGVITAVSNKCTVSV